MSARNSDIDAFMSRAKNWQDEMRTLRSIILDCGVEEELKWGKPCFTYDGKNVAVIQPFKKHCALMFFKGALLQDTHGLLRSQGANTRSAMRLEFTGREQIEKSVVKDYVEQAIAAEKAGLEVDFSANREPEYPEELTERLEQDSEFSRAFHALTPGRRRGYVLHFAGAKQSSTRTARIERCVPGILAGKGMSDR